MRRPIVRGLLVVVACLTVGSFAYAGEPQTAGTGETAGAKVDVAADKVADQAKRGGRAVKSTTKKAVKKTGSAVHRAGDAVEDSAK